MADKDIKPSTPSQGDDHDNDDQEENVVVEVVSPQVRAAQREFVNILLDRARKMKEDWEASSKGTSDKDTRSLDIFEV